MTRPTSGNDSTQQLLELLRELVAELRPGQAAMLRIDLDTFLDRDLGLDSLARMELLNRIERRFGVRLEERAVSEAERVRDLLAALSDAGQGGIEAAGERIEAVAGEGAWEVPVQAVSLPEVLAWHVERHPERPHVRFYADRGEGEVLSYRRLQESAVAVAGGLQALGVAPGERVAIMLPTGPDYLAAFYGTVLAGAVPVPIYPPVRLAMLEDHLRRQLAILSTCAATALIAFAEALPFARLLKLQLPSLKHLVSVAELGTAAAGFAPPPCRPKDTAMLQYTSGSTGNPKGVILSHSNLLVNIRAMGKAVQVAETDVIVSWLPLYHDMGLIGTWLAGLYYGLPLVLLSPLDFLARPGRWLWAIHRYRGTLSPAPNFAYEICLARLKEEELAGLDLDSWRCAFNGAEPVSPETLENFCARFAAYGFRRESLMPVYGLAENSVGLAFPPCGRGPLIDRIDREVFARSGKAIPQNEEGALQVVVCGRPLDGHEIRILGPGGQELPERREGQVQFRGPSATSGYFGAPEQSAKLFANGWLETGDLGYMAGGELCLTGRSKDLIIIAGRNVYPQELEEAVGRLPGIRKGNVVVFGCRDRAAGTERLVLVAETREADPVVRERLRQEINGLAVDLVGSPVDELVLAPPKSLLKTSSGKLRRAACRELHEQGRLGIAEPRWRMLLRIALLALGGSWQRLRQRGADQLYGRTLRLLFWLTAPGVWLAVVLLPRPAWRWACMRGALRFLSRAARVPLAVTGLEQMAGRGPGVVVANHASYLDGLVLVAALPPEFSFVAKAELESGRLSGPFLRKIGSVFVERSDRQQGVEDARRIGSLARAGQTLVYFPEGTFTRAPGLRPFRLGAFLAAAEASLPVVPVAIRGTRSILRGDDKLPHRGAIEVEIGAPIQPDPQLSSWDAALRLRELSRQYILPRCGEPDLGEGEG
ncbi:AMP-binding protein [Trichloromonas sp.]|uniref:AMP-binding protein n=1 Tax=Trichloromonas sp. TaxID=3069249 RepID=UPI003D8170A1